MRSIFRSFGRRLTRKLKEIAPVAIGAGVLVVVLWLVGYLVVPTLPAQWQHTLDLLGSGELEAARDRIVQHLEGALIPPGLAFVVVHVVQVLIAPIPGQIIGLVGGYFFGFWTGLIITIVGLAVGTSLAIGLARLLGEGVVRRLVPRRHVERFDELVNRGGLWSFFVIFLLPALPDDAACFLAGLTRLSIWKLVGVAVVGRLPGMAVLVFVGARAGEAGYLPYVVLSIAIALSIMLWLFSEEVEAWIEQHVTR